MKHLLLRNALFRLHPYSKIAIIILAIIPNLLLGQYLEDFAGQNGKGLVNAGCTGASITTCSPAADLAGVTWTIDGNFSGFDVGSPDDFGVINEALTATDVDNEVIWLSPTLLIGAAGTVSFSVVVSDGGSDFESTDYVDVEYSVNGGPFQLVTTAFSGSGHSILGNGGGTTEFGTVTVSKGSISGSTLVIRIKILDNAASETITIDDVSVPTPNVIIDPCGPIGDSDFDGVCNDVDGCPNDPNKTEPGNCGCGVPEVTPPVFAGLADICVGDGIQVLGGGQPTGGVYSGPGVTDNNNGSTFTFNPTAAGTFTVVYTVGSGGCEAEACSQLTVHAVPSAPQGQTIDACAAGSTEIIPVASGGGCTNQKVLFIESFETDGEQTRYDATLDAIGTPNAYFARVTDADLNIDYNGEVGSYYWAGEDHDNTQVGNGDPSLQIDLSAGAPTTNIVGETNVVFKGLFAANPNSPFSPNGSGAGVGEPDSYLRVDYQINAGFWTPALQFARSAGGVGLSLDTDFDGVGDCDLLTRDFKEFSFPIPNPGPLFKLRIFMHVDETGEEYAIDNFGIYADGPADCLFNFYDANPDLGPANLLAGPTASYDPNNTTTQSYWVTQVNSYGCEGPAAEFVVEINQPIVTFTAPTLDVCVEDGIITGLSGGAPSGGVYSGTGVTDNNGTFSFNPSATSGGNITVTYTLPGGCSSSASDDIFVKTVCCDPPVAKCVTGPVSLVLNGAGTVPLLTIQVDAGSTAGCGLQSLSVFPNSFNCASTGLQTVTLTVTDNKGDTDDCTTTVNVQDLMSPTLICPGDVSFNNQAGQCGRGIDVPTPIANDNCGIANLVARYRLVDQLGLPLGPFSGYSANPSGFYDVGRYEMQWLAVDPTGNQNTCSFYIQINDVQNPVALCKDITVQMGPSHTATITGADIDNGSSDNCGIGTLTPSIANFDCDDVGTTSTVTLTVTDVNGNSSTCTSNVTAAADVNPCCDAPQAFCQNVTVQLDAAGDASITTGDVDNGSTADCGLQSLSLDQTDFDCADVGINTVTLTVTDIAGGQSTCTATVTVEDNIAPTALCQNVTAQLNASGSVSISAATVNNGSSDVCGIASTILSKSSFGCGDVGGNSVTLTVTDNNGNTSTCTTTVTVEDNVAPTALCQNVTVQLNAAGTGSTTAAAVNNGSSDACGIASLSLDQTGFDCGDVGSQTVTLTVTDNNGNASTCTANVEVEDNVAPTAICMDITAQLNSSGIVTVFPASLNNGSFDNCGIATLGGSPTVFNCGNVGSNTLTLTVEDINGNTSTCTANVTVQDNTPPTAACKDITVQLDINHTATITGNDINGGSTDACGVSTLTPSQTSFDCDDLGPNTVTLTVFDTHGNSATCTSTVTVADDINPCCAPPQALCKNTTVQLDASGDGTLAASDVDNGSTAGCGLQSIGIDITNFDCNDVGTPSTVTLTVTDVNNDQSTCTATVTVEDNVAPTALCQNVTVQLNASGSGTISANAVDNGSSDACGIQSTVLSKQSFSCADIGANAVTLTVTDANGNASTCSATVSVEDNVAPAALCQNVTVQLDANGSGSTSAAAVDNGSNDACGIASASLSKTTFNCGDVGGNAVTLTVTDVNGNASTCSATVSVEDNVAPTALCQSVTVQLDANGSGSTTAAAVNNGSSDACGIASVSLSKTTFNCGDVGGNAATLTVTDVNGNASTCSATVSVEDNVAPTALCQSVTIQLDANGSGSAIAAAVDNGSDDACGIGSLVLSKTGFNCADIGGNTVTLTVTDANGNASTCSATVSVEDNLAPAALCQNVTVQLDANGSGSTTAAAVNNGSSDACGIASASLSKTTFDCGDVGGNAVTLTVTDANGNASTCSATVSVEDNVAPTALCQNVTVQLDANGNGSTTAAAVNNGSSDACGIASASLSKTTFNCGDVGGNAVTLTVTDVNGNASTCSATVSVEDNVAPTALCQSVTIQLDANGSGSATAAAVDNGSNDACGIGSLVLSKTGFNCADIGGNTVTLTVTDANGNASTCSATVSVEDNVAPTALCQNVTVQLDANGSGSTSAAAVDNGSNDACGIASASLSKTTFNCGDVGGNAVTLTVTDVNGNASTCSATVSVEDNVAPTALCQNVTVQLDANGSGSTSAAAVNNGSNDACGIASVSLSKTTFNCGDVGGNTVTLTVTDVNGNASTCSATVSVEDNVAPTALCQSVTVQLDANGSGSTSAAAVNNGSSDACGIASASLSKTTFNCGDVGGNAVTLTVTDANGNASTCSATVSVEDNVAPTALCQNVTVQLDANGSGSTSAAAVNNGSNDACGILSLSLSQTTFTCGEVGANTVTLTVTDNNNNASTCTATVQLEDNIPPTALCRNVTIQLDDNGDGSTTAAAVDNGSFDNCDVAGISLDQTSFGCADVGANSVTLTVTDVNGHSSTCTATVSVEDNVNPIALCNNITVLLDNEGNGEITAAQVDNGSNDACGILTLALNQTKFDCDDVGTVVVTLVATDVNGNQGSCPATISVLDPIAPEALCRNVTVQLDENGDGSTSPEAVDNGSNDACGIQSLVLSQTDFDCSEVGSNTVTLTVTDVNDNSSICSATVTVEDNVAPDAVCRNVTVQLDENGAASITAEGVDNGSSDACGIASLSLGKYSFDCSNTGTVNVTLTVTDVNGNTSTCTATVAVEDNVDPEVDCADITVTFNGQASIALNPESMASATDNCAVTGFEADPPSIPCDALGEIVPVTVTVHDPSGNSASCTSNVTVEGLPCGWMSMPDGIGCTNGNNAGYDVPSETFTLMASGCYTPSATSDESGYIKYQLCGDGSITAHIAGLTLPGFAGIVMRESDAPGAKKVAMAYQGANAIARYVRYSTNGASFPSYINAFNARWLRIVRSGNIFRGYYSANGINWVYAFAVTVPMNNCIQVGLIAWGTNPNSVVTATFDHVVINPPYNGGVMRGDDEQTEAVPTTDLPVVELWPNPTTGIFTLTLDGAWSASKTVSMVNIQVADELGRVIREDKVDAAVESMVNFDLSGQAPGLYFVRIVGPDGNMQVRKLVIAR